MNNPQNNMTNGERLPVLTGIFAKRRRRSFAPLIAAVVVSTMGLACQGRPKSTSGSAKSRPSFDAPAVVEIDLGHGAPELPAAGIFAAGRGRGFADLVQTIESANNRSTTKGFFIRLGTAGFGLARAHEIGRLLDAIRKSKKPVVCHADDLGNGTLLLASVGCDRIWLSPAAGVNSIGLAAEMLYGKRLLDKLHVDVNFLQVGKYKGAKEPFTNDSASPEARESLEGALRGMRTAWLDAISKGRNNPELSSIVEDGPYAPEEAKTKGLIDAVGYVDEAREEAKKLAGAERIVTRFGGGPGNEPVSNGLVGVLRALAGPGGTGEPRIAVAIASGGITMTSSQSPLGGSEGISERDLGKTAARLTEDESVKAVVLRIDSPGGSALASDLIWKKLMKLRSEKPLVISVGGMAASGGYYLACAGTKIVADETSIIGSIGVVSGKLAVKKTLDELGVSTEIVAAAPDPKKAARAAYMSPFTGWDEATQGKVLSSMTSVYDLFVQRIAEGRGFEAAKVGTFAEGRIFGGVEAKERGMIDELGGLSDAITLARKLASLPDDVPVDILGGPAGLLELLDADAEDPDARSEAAKRSVRQTAWATVLPEVSGIAPPALGTFLGSMTPLLTGERMLVAMPFGLQVQ
ncbi:MAG TPA: signal peptide peptidase SppA [Polyangium sp.]|jgi:protease-4|nr:signal peptide peptidase SppA [Polyangium sp.]